MRQQTDALRWETIRQWRVFDTSGTTRQVLIFPGNRASARSTPWYRKLALRGNAVVALVELLLFSAFALWLHSRSTTYVFVFV